MLTTKTTIHRILVCCAAISIASTSVDSKELEARYWFDSNSDKVYTCRVESGGIELSIPEEGLPKKAIHQLNLQIKDSKGQWSGIYTALFTANRMSPLRLAYEIDGHGGYTSMEVSDPYIDGNGLTDGLHHLTIVDPDCNLSTANSLFSNNTVIGDNLTLSLESSRNNVRKDVQIAATAREAEIDVADLDIGIYPAYISIKNSVSQTLKGVGSLVNITPQGGERVTGIYYWLNDSVDGYKEILIPDGEMPFSCTADLDVADLSVPTSDYSIAVDSIGIDITPNFNVGLAFMSNRGLRTDTASYYKDNSKTETVIPVTLQSGVQYDFGNVSPQDVLWAKIPVRENDRVRFTPRWESTVKMFDDTATPVDTIVYADGVTKSTFTSTADGAYYVQIYDIAESIRDFSVKMQYLEGPSVADSTGQDTHYEGIPIVWNSKKDWNETESSIGLTVDEITMSVNQADGQFMPEVAERNGVCVINKGNSMVFSIPSGYMDLITLCVPQGYDIPEVRASEGDVTVDRDSNTIVWKGMTKNVQLSIKDFYYSSTSDENRIAGVILEKAYVRISDIGDDRYEDITGNTADFDYTPYNYLRIWDNGDMVGEYTLTGDIVLSLSDTELIVMSNGVKTGHPINDRLILTYSYEEGVSGVDAVEPERPSVEISGDSVIFSGLPAFVGIYSLNGHVVFQGHVDDPHFSYPVRDLTPGIYIIKVGASSTKMLIK